MAHKTIVGPTVQEHEEHELKQESPDGSIVSRTAVLADAEGLLTCYGVGEESTGQLTHAVIELCFTSSVRFLQPGLLLQVRTLQHIFMLQSGSGICHLCTKGPLKSQHVRITGHLENLA
jgi:hypothetical protein